MATDLTVHQGALSTHYRVETVRSALPHAAAVLTRGTTEASLRHAAEGLLNALGFSVADLQLVANDAELLSEWARMHLDIRMSLSIDFSLTKLIASAWPHADDSAVTPVFPFFDSRVDVTQPDASAIKRTGGSFFRGPGMTQPRWTNGVKAAVSDLASAPPGEFLKVLAGGLGHAQV